MSKLTPAPRRDKRLEIRLDPELFDSITELAADMGGASVLVRTLLRKYADGKITVSLDDIQREQLPALRRRQK